MLGKTLWGRPSRAIFGGRAPEEGEVCQGSSGVLSLDVKCLRKPLEVPSMVSKGEMSAEEHIASIFERIDRLDPKITPTSSSTAGRPWPKQRRWTAASRKARGWAGSPDWESPSRTTSA